MFDMLTAPVLLNGERATYMGSLTSLHGRVVTIVDATQDDTGAWRYLAHVEGPEGLVLDRVRRASLLPLTW